MKKILIINDSALSRGQMRDLFLKNELAECWESKGEIEAVEKYRMLKPDLVIITVSNMMDVAVVKKVIDVNQKAKILALGSKGHESYIGEAVQSGALDYIIEPFDEKDLLATIMKIL